MKKIFFLIVLSTLIGGNTYSQTKITKGISNKKAPKDNSIQCKLSVEDVLRQQLFVNDHPKSEKQEKSLLL